MWQAIIPIIASVLGNQISKNNPKAANVIHTASQLTNLYQKK